MGKRAQKHGQNFKFDPYDDFDDMYDDDFNAKDLSRDIHSTEWGEPSDRDDKSNARRKIERRNEMKKLYSELNDWEEFGNTDEWQAY